MTTTNETRIKRASDAMAKGLQKLRRAGDDEMADRLERVLAEEMQRIREGK